MIRKSGKNMGLWDPFQMAELHGLQISVILTTYPPIN